MKRQDSLYPQDWLQFAELDWQRIKKRLDEDDHQDAAVHLQQALEKYLKAFLLANGWKLEKTHEISTLLNEAIKYKPELSNFADLCEEIENYYFAERYPLSLDAGTPPEEIAQNFQVAHKLREMLLTIFAPKPEVMVEEKNKSGTKEEQAHPSSQDKNAS